MLGIFILAAVLTEIVADRSTYRSVRGTHRRVVWATTRRTASWAGTVGFLLQGLLAGVTGDYFFGTLNILFGIFGIWQEKRRRHDDDDWWTGRWTKIKKGLRRNAVKPAPVFNGA